MTDYNMLKAVVYGQGLTLTKLAQMIGMTYQTFSSKVNNRRVFDVNEVRKIQEALSLSNKDRDKIFFGDRVDDTST